MTTIKKFTRMISLLEKEDHTPTMIARKLGADKRTIDKMIQEAMKMNLIGCQSLKISGKQYRVCSLSDGYKKIYSRKRTRR